MRRPHRLSAPALAAILAALLPAAAPAAGPVETTERRFHVPFRFDPAELDRLGAVEIRLFVSADRGRSWSLAATAAPGEERFPYEAPADGEYWFAVRTIDRRGDAHPPGPIAEPGLKVLIDRDAPTLRIGLEALADGAVGLTWEAADASLDLGSLSLEFREGSAGPWMPVAVVASEAGRTSWRTAAGRVEVRGSVRDRLGHRGFGQAEIDLAAARPAPQPVGMPQAMTPRDPFAGFGTPQRPATNPGFSFETPAPSGPAAVPTFDFDANAFGGNSNAFGGNANAFGESGPDVPSLPQLDAGPVPSLDANVPTLGPGFSTPTGPTAFGPAASGPVASGPVASGPAVSGPIASGPALNNGFGFTATPISRPVAPGQPADDPFFRPGPQPAFTPQPAFAPAEPVFAGTRPSPAATATGERIVRDLDFEISYEVADVGPSGVSAVEFYITDDGGRSWWTYGPDKDRVSPFVATVPREGRYGFTMRIRNGQGIGDAPPAAGDAPDIVVVVDRTPPCVNLADPVVGRGPHAGTVTLRWQTDETYPAANAVAISYATSPEGPWQPVTTWGPDAGKFVWAIDAGLPPRVFVRTSVRDAAGNVSHAISRSPVTIDLQRPQARITNIDGRR